MHSSLKITQLRHCLYFYICPKLRGNSCAGGEKPIPGSLLLVTGLQSGAGERGVARYGLVPTLHTQTQTPDTDQRQEEQYSGWGRGATINHHDQTMTPCHGTQNTAQTHCIKHSLAYWKIFFLHGYLKSFIYYIHHTSYIHNRSSLDIKIWLRLNAFRLHNQSKAKLTINSLLFILACVSKYLCDSSRHWLKITLIGLLWWMSQDWYVPCICRVSALACLYWLCGLCLEGDWWLIQWLLPPSHPSSAHIQTSQNHRNNNKYACVSSNMELGKSVT